MEIVKDFFPVGTFVHLSEKSPYYTEQGFDKENGIRKIGVVTSSDDGFFPNHRPRISQANKQLLVRWLGDESWLYTNVIARGKEMIASGVQVHQDAYYYYKHELVNHHTLSASAITEGDIEELIVQDFAKALTELRTELRS